METGKRIKAYRQAAHKTQLELADAIGVNRVTITKYESGVIAPPIEKLEKIAAALECSIVDLIDKEAFYNASGEDRAAILDAVADEQGKIIDRAAAVCALAGYKWRPLLRENQQPDGSVHFIDLKTNTEYAVSDEAFTAAVNGSLEYIDLKFEKMMKSAKVVDDGK